MSATTWVEISRGALRRNYEAVVRFAGVEACAVVKADAYGCGLIEAARVFREAGAARLAVTRIEEARALRGAGVDGDVLLLVPPAPDSAGEALALDCALTVGSADEIDAVSAAATAAGRDARVHLKVDTGMGRLGVRPADAPAVASRIEAASGLVLEGVWTHFADAAGRSGAAALGRFSAALEAVRRGGSLPKVAHAANSAGLLALPGARFDMVRVGTLLYGQQPPGATAPFPLEDPFAWYARVASVRTLPAGATVGYGGEWRARRATTVATVPVGWADGFTVEPHARTESAASTARTAARSLAAATGLRPSARYVTVAGRRAEVAGRVGMQAFTFVVPGGVRVEPGDAVRLPARRLLVGAGIERVYVS